MTILDLLGTFAGAAFLAGSVTLAILTDRREGERAERLTRASESPGGRGRAAGAHQLRFAPDPDT
jgi:hypothetical protein